MSTVYLFTITTNKTYFLGSSLHSWHHPDGEGVDDYDDDDDDE